MTEAVINRLLRYPASLRSRCAIAWLRLLGMRIGRRCTLRRVEVPRNPWHIELEDQVALDRGVVLLADGPRTGKPKIVIRKGCYINRSTMIDASEHIELGENCLVGPYCYLTDHDHGIDRNRPIIQQPLHGLPVVVGKDVWIGAGVIILKGVTIGDGAVVGAGTVVTRDVPPLGKVVGAGERLIGMRDSGWEGALCSAEANAYPDGIAGRPHG
jgi:acetyltransferase-like isoleucine patch superfamily enzyme